MENLLFHEAVNKVADAFGSKHASFSTPSFEVVSNSLFSHLSLSLSLPIFPFANFLFFGNTNRSPSSKPMSSFDFSSHVGTGKALCSLTKKTKQNLKNKSMERERGGSSLLDYKYRLGKGPHGGRCLLELDDPHGTNFVQPSVPHDFVRRPCTRVLAQDRCREIQTFPGSTEGQFPPACSWAVSWIFTWDDHERERSTRSV